jgi:hypothetical protein
MNALERNRTEITAGAGFGAMSKTAADILLTFPPRSLGPGERALVDEWLGRAGDVAMAYVSERRSDDPNFFGRVVITTGPGAKPSHVIHPPVDCLSWLVISMERPCEVQRFETLRDALNSVRPVLQLT